MLPRHAETHPAFVFLLRVHMDPTHAHTHTNAHRPYVYRHRRSEQEVEEARLQRALTGSLNTGLMPASSLCARGGGGTANFAGDFYPIMGRGQSLQTPYTATHRRAPGPTAAATCIVVPSPMTSAHVCPAHMLPACVTCKRLHPSAATCCSKGQDCMAWPCGKLSFYYVWAGA